MLIFLQLALLALPSRAALTIQPYVFEPVNGANSIRFTSVDSVPDSTDTMYATGTYFDAASGEYAILSVNINGYGTSYETELAWTMTPALVVEVEPVVVVRDGHYLIWYQLDSSKDIYLFESPRDETNLSNVKVTKFTLPTAY